MADREISTLPAAEELTDDALFVGDFGGEAQKFSGEQLKKYVSLDVVSAEAETLPDGSDATAQYSPQTKKLAIGIPRGKTGTTPALTIGTVTLLPAGSEATATITGTAEAPMLNLGIPKGDTGLTPNISIGLVATLPAGSDAVVTITGTAEAPVLNLSLPQGKDGVSPDKDEIVQEVLEYLPTWSGGDY